MLLAAVSFIPHMDHEEGELVLVAEDYLTALVKNGQIHGNFVSGWIDGVYTAYVHVSHRDAHKRDAASQWVRRTEKLVQLQYGTVPQWEIVDDESSLPVPQLSSASYVYLMSHAMHEGSPVWHGQRGTCLPMPLLPISDRLKEELYHWAMLCRSYDQIWTMEGPLAQAAWQQLSDWNSDFYQEGRRLAAELQAQADKPCFIYLWNDFPATSLATSLATSPATSPAPQVSETSETEAAEDQADSEVVDVLPCPGCGTPWEVDRQQIPSREPFRKFHYRCNSCQIVTHEPQVPWEERTCFAAADDEAAEDEAADDEAADDEVSDNTSPDPETTNALSPGTDDPISEVSPDQNVQASDADERQ